MRRMRYVNWGSKGGGLMGYQESLINVDCIAEVAGIDRAIRESEEVKVLEYLNCYCAARARCDMYWGGWFGGPLSDVPESEQPIITADSLFAVVGGARLYQPFLWIDCIAGMESGSYADFFEDIKLEVAYEEAERNPEAMKKAELRMRKGLKRSYDTVMSR